MRALLRLARPSGRILFANSDLSGISVFEEAQYHGVEAVQTVRSYPVYAKCGSVLPVKEARLMSGQNTLFLVQILQTLCADGRRD